MELWIGVIASVLAVGLGSFLVVTQQQVQARIFGLVGFSASAYVLSLTLLFATQILLFSDAVIIAGACVLASALAFALQYMRKPKAWHFLALLPMVIVVVTTPLGWYVAGARVNEITGDLVPVNGPLAPVLAVVVALHCLATWALLARSITKAEGLERIQARLVLLAFTLLLSSILVCNVVAPLIGFTTANMLTAVSLVGFLGCVAYALTVQRLFDVQMLLYRGFRYLAIPVSAVTGIGVAVGSIALLNQNFSLKMWVLSTFVGAIFGVFFAQVLMPKSSEMVRQLLFPGYRSAEQIEEIVGDVVETLATKDELRVAIRSLLVQVYGPKQIDVRTVGSDAEMIELTNNILKIGVPEIGVYTLTGRRSGEPYTGADREIGEQILPTLLAAVRRAEEREEELRAQAIAERQLVGEIAHGIQTPLAVLRGELDRDESVSAELHHKVNRALDDLSARMRNLTTYARVGMPLSGEQQGVVRLDALVREIVEFVSVVAEADGVRIECAELPELEINGRREDLATLINNLINNAIRFAAQGEKIHTVFISGVRRFNTLSLTIADTGPGMTPAERGHAFEPLFRGAGATPGTGMGLGLAIAKHVVETHRGTIACSERPGGGEQVTVNFPTGGVDQK